LKCLIVGVSFKTAVEVKKSLKSYLISGVFIVWESSLQFANWSGVLPQNPHDSPSLFKNGLWLAQVPANFPSFLAQILIAIPATPNNNSPKVISNSFIW
tara:strand:+ start:20030 stop:20326 length:297 start_codon:yes stop_codon:yes gene_type:complete